MPPLTAREALDRQVVRVTATMRAADLQERRGEARLYTVFREEDGGFLGMVTEAACADFPHRIFADLVREPQPKPVEAGAPAEVVFQQMEEGAEAHPVLDEQGHFLGAITRPSLLKALLQRERERAEEGRERLLEQVRSGRERLRALCGRLLQVQEAERLKLARDLHDEVGQILTGLKLTLEIGARGCTDEAKASLGKAEELVNDLITRVHELSLGLRPTMLDDLGLLPALLWHFKRYTAQTQVRVVLEQAGLGGRFAPEVETAAYRIVQEALTNVARHAGVNVVAVRLWTDLGKFGVQVQDCGRGFDPEAALATNTTGGLAGMRERAELLGGSLTVEAAPGVGTRVTVELPLSNSVERRRRERGA